MVNLRKATSLLLTFGLFDRSAAVYNRTSQTVSYTPIVHDWAGEGPNLTAHLDRVKEDYTNLYDNDHALSKRRKIDVVKWAQVVSAGTGVIIAGGAGATIYSVISAVIKSKADVNSCALTWGTDGDGRYFEDYAYHASTTGHDCRTTAEHKTVLAGVKKCAEFLHKSGAVTGCCRFSHGGTWHGHLRLSGERTKYPVHEVTC